MLDDREARALLRRMFDTAVAAADPHRVLAPHLPEKPAGRCIVVGAGKAAAAMAVAVERAWGDVVLSGSVVVPYGYGCSTGRVHVREAAHPVPDGNSEAAAREMLGLVEGLTPDDLVLALISGGGSAVMALPVPGLTLADKQQVNRALLASGLDIRSMNAVRRRLSAIKGGKLAAAAEPARVVTLAISDIPGDHAAAIASGPTIADHDAGLDLAPIAHRLRPHVSSAVFDLLVAPATPVLPRRPADVRMIATPLGCLHAAASVARAEGLDVEILGDDLEGESRDLACELARHAMLPGKPRVLISGGETTVTLAGHHAGRGGRNTEFALAFALATSSTTRVWAISADTDGEDGASGGGAGAIVTPDTLRRAHAQTLDARRFLDAHDSGSFFDMLGDLLVTGPTRTNVNDFRAILIDG